MLLNSSEQLCKWKISAMDDFDILTSVSYLRFVLCCDVVERQSYSIDKVILTKVMMVITFVFTIDIHNFFNSCVMHVTDDVLS